MVLAFRVAARLAGPAAGATAALAAALAEGQVRNGLQGYSEPLLICLALGAVDAHLGGRRRLAFGLGVLGSLVRPELWLLVALYGLWTWRSDARFRPLIAAGLVAVPALWVGLDWWGSGELLHGGSVARSTPPESAALTDRPALTVVRRAAELVTAPVLAAAIAAAALALRRRDAVVTALAAAAALWVAAVAVMAELGFTGNIRYLAVPAGLLAVLGGVGVGWLIELAPPARRLAAGGAAAALLLSFAFVPARAGVRWLSVAREQHDQLDELRDATELAGAARLSSPTAVRRSTRPWRPRSRGSWTSRSTGCRPRGAPRPPTRTGGRRRRCSGRRLASPGLHPAWVGAARTGRCGAAAGRSW